MKFLSGIYKSRYFVIFLLTFVNGLSMTMLFPVLPFIIKSYSQPEVVLGVLLWTFSLFQFIAAPALWAMSDSYGRKPVLLLTQAGTLLSWIILWIAYLLPSSEIFWVLLLPIFVIFLSRMFDGITGWNASVAQAVLADMTQPNERSKVFWMNGAVFGMALLVGPALWSLSVGLGYWFLGTAVLGAIISCITLIIMKLALVESLPESERKEKVKIKLKEINVFMQIMKWWNIETIRYALTMKLFMFTAFVFYTSTSALYLMDKFNFSASNIGYYLTFTGSFLIFHQSVSIKYFLKRYGDRLSLKIALWIMFIWFLSMWLSSSIIVFTIFYFIAVLWISLSFTTLWALFSRCVDSKNQWEVLWMSTWVESLISIGSPILATLIYSRVEISIFIIISFLPLVALLLSSIFFTDLKFQEKR